MIHTQFNLLIKTLRTDHGGKYTSHDFQSYLLHHDIHHQFSCPYTLEQNGIADRKNRHILETARTLLHHASLPPIFWLEVTTTAAYLINRLPTKTLNMTSPYHKLYHQSTSYLHLKTFGCLYYSWTAYSRTHKLDPKSSPCIFLGYSSDYKGFRCFDLATSKLIISRHVRFHEHEFPMAKPTHSTPPPQISTIHNPLSPLFTPTFYPTPTTPNPQPYPQPASHPSTPTSPTPQDQHPHSISMPPSSHYQFTNLHITSPSPLTRATISTFPSHPSHHPLIS